jgi:uncharacterized protein (TIGR03086 family)
MDPVERIEKATAVASKVVGGVKDDDLGKSTPCTEFDVRELLRHMIGGLDMLTSAAEGGEAKMPEGEVFTDPGKDYEAGRAKLLDAIRKEGVFDRGWKMPFGELPGNMMATIAYVEHLTHAWDLAKATGQDTTMPDDLAKAAYDSINGKFPTDGSTGFFKAAPEVPDDASTQVKLLSLAGRKA